MATEGEDGCVLSAHATTLPPPPSRCACHLPLAGEDCFYPGLVIAHTICGWVTLSIP
jgi:hypothetical protein